MARGFKTGGRVAGTPNKATGEKLRVAAEIAARTHGDARASGKKLGKDVLEDFMHLFAGMAATYQPYGPMSPTRNPHEDESRFKEYARLACQCAKELADFQSPRFKTTEVPRPNDDLASAPSVNILVLDDPIAVQQVYQRMLRAPEEARRLPAPTKGGGRLT